MQTIPESEQLAFDRALNECIAVGTKLACSEPLFYAERSLNPEATAAAAAAIQPVLEPDLLDFSDAADAAPVADTNTSGEAYTIHPRAHSLLDSPGQYPLRPPDAPVPAVNDWSRAYLMRTEDETQSCAFRIMRAAVLTQPILASYFESPLLPSFL